MKQIIVPLAVLALLVCFFYVASQFVARLSRAKSKIYGMPEPEIPYLGLLTPPPRNQKKPQDIEYRKLFFHEYGRVVLTSVIIWLAIYLLTRI